MPQNPDLARNPDYFSARATEERQLAATARDAKARAAHLQLAQKYSELADAMRATQPVLQLVGDGEQAA
jgi:hypothetical protein